MSYDHTNMRRLAVALLTFAAILLAGAQPSRAQEDGGSAGATMRWGFGARAVALGGAYTAIADGPTGFWWNPAGVAQVHDNQAETSWRAMSFDRQAGYVAFLHPFSREDAAMAFSWAYSGVTNLYEYDIDGVQGNSIASYTNAATFTFARRFTRVLSLGVNLRYLQQNIANLDAYTIGFDLGIHLRFAHDWQLGGLRIPMKKVHMGVVLQQVNQKYPWDTRDYWVRFNEPGSSPDERFPVIVRSGIAVSVWRNRAIISVDAEFNERQATRMHAGAELRPYRAIALRGGMDGTNPTLGAGWETALDKNLHVVLDYAYASQPGPIDAEHVFSLGVRF